MKRAIIFANGRLEEPPDIVKSLQPADLIIAADGGAHHCQSLGITPNVIIGDFDSLDQQEIASFEHTGIEIKRYPKRKNETDLELALQYAVEQSAGEIYILGAMGARWDMTVANILLIAHPRFSGLKIHMLDAKQELILLRGKEKYEVHGQPGAPISLIPLAGDVKGITTDGLEYALKDETLYFGSPRGVSNTFLHDNVQISVRDGILLCILNWVEN